MSRTAPARVPARVPARPGLSWRVRGVMLLALIAVLAIYGGSVLLSTTRDRVDQIDTKPVEQVAVAACTQLRVSLDAQPALPPGATTQERAGRVSAVADVVQRFDEQVRRVGDRALDADVPSRTWLQDWHKLVAARQAFVAGEFSGVFAVPVEDGQPITRRMNEIGLDACQVPRALVDSP